MSIKEMESTARDLKELQRMREDLDAEISSLQDALKAAMGDDEQMTAGPYKITWKAVTSQRVDATALRKGAPDIAALYTKTTTTRRFTVA